MNKRGISPLIATLLLIAFSVGLGAVVMSYGEAYVEERAEFVTGGPEVSASACEAVDVQLIAVKGVPQLCVRGAMVELLLDNGPAIAVDGLQARVVGSQDVALIANILQSPLAPAASLKTSFAFSPVGDVQQVKLSPVLQQDGAATFCPGKAIVVEDVPRC